MIFVLDTIETKTFWDNQLLGVIIGALLTAGFTAIIEWIRFLREIKQKNLEERKKCYIEILKLYHLEKERKLVKNQLTPNISKIITQRRQDLLANFQVVASKKILDKWNEVSHDNKGTFNDEDLIESIRLELNIKD